MNNEIVITQEFKNCEKYLDNGFNVYLSGSAGTGKTTFLKYYKNKHQDKNILLIAPTGIAALNIDGTTIHSTFRFPFKPLVESDIEWWNHKQKAILRNADLIVIDEVSMVKPDILEAISLSFQKNLKSKKHFGGKQILLIGDIFQLAPVVPNYHIEYYNKTYGGVYFFNASSFKSGDFVFQQFTHIFRQTEKVYIDRLQEVRQLKYTQNTLDYFNKRVSNHTPKDVITITSFVKTADDINMSKLNEIKGDTKTFIGVINGKFDYDQNRMLTPLKLNVKKGAQVMFTVNDMNGMFRNGTIGTIVEIDDDIIYVKTKTHDCIPVQRYVWTLWQTDWDNNARRFTQHEKGSFIQYPLALGWAVTIHKSQGQTYDDVIIDTGTGTFVFGQLYVALSRCTRYEGIYLKNKKFL